MNLLMDDDIEGAERALEDGHSSFHELARGVITFLRASLGLEADAISEAATALSSAELSAEADRKRALKQGHSRGRLPPGLEYAICSTEAQLLSAVIGLLSESLIETMKSFYKLRSAYKSLEALQADINKLELAAQESALARDASSEDDSGDDTKLELARSRTASARLQRDEFEIFTLSGFNLCFGMLQLFLGIVPPSLSRLMNIIGFRGDTNQGLELLWKSSPADNVHGALATLIILLYYSNIIQFCDITPGEDEAGGYPRERCWEALSRVRERYPHSALWRLGEARMKSASRDLRGALDLLSDPSKSQMRQITALIVFERAIISMFLHQYDDASEAILKLLDLSKWSHGFYHYFAAICNIEQYRVFKETDPSKAEQYANTAEELLVKIPTLTKMRFMAQGLPLEVFAERKLKKWQARATSSGGRLVDGVGASPIAEMIYIWNGYNKMKAPELAASERALERGKSASEDVDEKAIKSLLLAVIHRKQDDLTAANTTLAEVLNLQKANLKGQHHDEWMIPTAYYEKAVMIWAEKEKSPEQLTEARDWLKKAAEWGPFDLDSRIGMKIRVAQETLKTQVQ